MKTQTLKNKSTRNAIRICALPILAFFAVTASAATGTWTGGAFANWDTNDTNWTGVIGTPWDSSNGPTNVAAFGTASTVTLADSVYAGSIGLSTNASTIGFEVTDSNTYTVTGNWTGSGITAGDGYNINKTGTGTLVLEGNLTLVGDVNSNLEAGFSVEGGGTLRLAGTIKAASTSQINRGNYTNLVGQTSANNSLVIASTAGSGLGGGLSIGMGAFGGNSMTISNAGNATTSSYKIFGNGAQLNIGNSTTGNTLTIDTGAYLNGGGGGGTNTWSIGTSAGGDNNGIYLNGSLDRSGLAGSAIKLGTAGNNNFIVMGTGSLLKPRRIEVGAGTGTGNYISNAGGTINQAADSNSWFDMGLASGANSNSVTVSASGIWNFSPGSNARQFTIGKVAGASFNYVQITGSGSQLNHGAGTGTIIGIGGNGTGVSGVFNDAGATALGNHLDIYDGGAVTTAQSIVLGGGTTGTTGSDPNQTRLNIGNNGTNIGVLTVGATSGFAKGVLLNNANTEVHFNKGRLVAGAAIGTGDIISGSGSVFFDGPAYIQIDSGVASITRPITGVGSVTKEGAGTLSISGTAPAYSGNTTISDGILSVASSTAWLNDASSVTISATGFLNLNFSSHSVQDTIAGLTIDNVSYTGTVGPSGSGATHQLAAITGTGVLNVTGVPEPGAAVSLLGGLGILLGLRRRRS